MKKEIYFDVFDEPRWPDPSQLEPYFLAPKGKEWSYRGRNDNWGLRIEGVSGTERLAEGAGRIDVDLSMWGNPLLGVLLIYAKRGGGQNETYTSKGNLSRLKDLVRSLKGTPLPVGLFIPFDEAWKAVKEFIETDGRLPTSIEWIANRDLPPNTFPDP